MRILGSLLLLTAISCLPCRAADEVLPRAVDYATQIRPLLSQKCFDCHGSETQEGRLRLDLRTAVLRGGDSGEPALVPGDAGMSHLIQLVSGREAGKVMPPDPEERLTAEEISLLSTWINEGAKWPTGELETDEPQQEILHWSFQPVHSPALPATQSTWVQNGVDAWILESLTKHELKPSPEADRVDLIRRLYLDMTGLLPAPEEVEQFVQDKNPEAWANLVNRVLESPHYGERWGRYWLDLVRFAETNGYETNRERPNAWPYRDYVIRSLNNDKPYDQFIREQIAGDLTGAPEATAFLVAGPYDIVKSPDISLTLMQRQNELDDIVSTTASAFLGLTVGCARCHNHKFDPIRQTDYYSLQAVFSGVQHGDRAIPLSEAEKLKVTDLERQIMQLRQQLKPAIRSQELTREAVTARENQELFDPVSARLLRFTIEATNSGEPCLDELEVFSGDQNVALASAGAMVTSSSSLQGYAIHRLEHINDGIAGNAHSWISAEPGRGWVQLVFPTSVTIDRIVWARDREGQFQDRVATQYRIEISGDGETWTTIASSADRAAFSTVPREPDYDFSGLASEDRERNESWLRDLKRAQADLTRLKFVGTVYAGTFQQPGPTHRLFRGEPTALREQVVPDTVAFLGQLKLSQESPESERRLAFANWVASRDNPLTARVMINRLWQFHFGQGLVSTPGDFGLAGAAPTHPELLDWLSRELMDHGWSLKHIHRLILLSATYRQDSLANEAGLQKDAGTAWWWRFPPRRLEAEPIRDCILQVTGVLDRTMYGPGFSAFEVELENVRHYFPKKNYGPADWKRMVYQTRVRLERESVFGAFDCPDAATSVPRRSRSTTPLQALNLFNSTFMLQQAELFAGRLHRDCGESAERQVERAFLLCFGRRPDSEEFREGIAFVQEEGLEAFCRATLNSNELVFIP